MDWSLYRELQAAGLGVSIGAVVSVAHFAMERLGFEGFRWLETKGFCRRFIPDCQRQLVKHPEANLMTVFIPYIFLGTAIARCWQGDMADRMQLMPQSILSTFAFLWVGMVLHDTWFFLVHRMMHGVKILYRTIHQGHHQNTAGVTALGTSTGEAADVGFCFVAFHFLVFWYLYQQPTWHLPTVAVYTFFEEVVNVTGHCGYKMPLWLHAVLTGGVGLTPWAATSKTHYIHHVDCRYNRALYFTWWDRLFETHSDSHPLIKEELKRTSSFENLMQGLSRLWTANITLRMTSMH